MMRLVRSGTDGIADGIVDETEEIEEVEEVEAVIEEMLNTRLRHATNGCSTNECIMNECNKNDFSKAETVLIMAQDSSNEQ
jgi:hypothetical protein